MSRISTLASRPKRTLGALVVVLAAVGVTVGSGASFTASQANAGNIFTSGKLTIGRDNTSVILSADKMKPGDSTGPQYITVSNTGDIKGDFTLTQALADDTASGLDEALQLTVKHCSALTGACAGSDVYSGNLSGFTSSGYPLLDMTTGASWDPAAQNRYQFTVSLPSSVNDDSASVNTIQGKKITATWTWKAQTA